MCLSRAHPRKEESSFNRDRAEVMAHVATGSINDIVTMTAAYD